MSPKTPADQLMMAIAEARIAGREAEAKQLLDQLKRDYPRADSPLTEQVLEQMISNMPRH